MDVQTAAPGPALPLGVAVALGVLALAAAGRLLLARPGRAGRTAGVTPGRAVVGFPDDDLPAFREHPPGFPGALVPGARIPEDLAPARRPPAAPATGGPLGSEPVRVLTAMALAALLLAAVAAVAAWAARREDPAGRSAPPTPPAAVAASPAGPSPAAMSVPPSPVAGQLGAGALADATVPTGPDGVSADLTFGVVLLDRYAVGVTVARPHVVLSADGDGTAVAHVRFDPENCLTPAPPPDPVTAGCVPAAQEYADLPAPALTVSRDGGTVTVTGRFPTYTRPAGRPAVYTGRVRDLAVTVRRSGPESAGPVPAYGQLALDGGPASALDGPGSTLVQPGD